MAEVSSWARCLESGGVRNVYTPRGAGAGRVGGGGGHLLIGRFPGGAAASGGAGTDVRGRWGWTYGHVLYTDPAARSTDGFRPKS